MGDRKVRSTLKLLLKLVLVVGLFLVVGLVSFGVWLRWHAAQLVEKGLGVLIGWCQLLALFVEVPLFRQRQLAGAMVDMEVRVRRGPEFLLA